MKSNFNNIDLQHRLNKLTAISNFIEKWKDKNEQNNLQEINDLRKILNPDRVKIDVDNNIKDINSWCLEGVLGMLHQCDYNITVDYKEKCNKDRVSLVEEFYNYAKGENLILREIKKGNFKDYEQFMVDYKDDMVKLNPCLILMKYDDTNRNRWSHISLCCNIDNYSIKTFGFNERDSKEDRQGGAVVKKERNLTAIKGWVGYTDLCFVKVF